MFRALCLSLALAAAVAGCTEMRWRKEGGDEVAAARDLSACRKDSQDRYGSPGAVLSMPVDPRFGPTGPSPADARMQESDAVGRCMRGKGYAPVPVER